MSLAAIVGGGPLKNGERIRSFSVDFNWDAKGFAPPGVFAHASPEDQVQWYKALGANTIQTFCVNCCGYAWYRNSAVAPVQPGLKSDFLNEITRLGHAEGMLVMGYFCVGANDYWDETHPELTYGSATTQHIPLTNEYVDYLCASIQDALEKTAIDGFMIDWFYNPPADLTLLKEIRWLPCERQMFEELMGRPFPGREHVDEATEIEFHRRAVDRCWQRVKMAVRSTRPDCIIWLTCFNPQHPQVKDSALLREVDWLMNENCDPKLLVEMRKEVGPNTKIIQCLSGWGDQHKAGELIRQFSGEDVGFFGFARPDEQTALPPKEDETEEEFLKGNARNIEEIRKAYRAERDRENAD